MISKEKINLIKKIINIFEMGTENIIYDSIYIYSDGPGNKRQLTISFGITEYGNLKDFITKYVALKSLYSGDFAPYISKIGKTALVDNSDFKNLLKKAAREDPAYRDLIEVFFDLKYLNPALKFAEVNKFETPLGILILVDSYIHSGSILSFLRNRFPEKVPAAGGSEKSWATAYIKTRRSWLANHSNKILRNTVYRCDFFLDLIRREDWPLNEREYLVHGTKLKIC